MLAFDTGPQWVEPICDRSLPVPIYLAGSFEHRYFALHVARLLQFATITYAWWLNKNQDQVQESQIVGLNRAKVLYILDHDAGADVAWEFGYWHGLQVGRRQPMFARRFHTAQGSRFAWYGGVAARSIQVDWDPKLVAKLIDEDLNRLDIEQ